MFSAVRPHLAVFIGLLILAGACQGGGTCGGGTSGCDNGLALDGLRIGGDYEFPRRDALDNALSVYITDDGFSFLESSGIELLAAVLDVDTDRIDLTPFIEGYLEANPVDLLGYTIRDLEIIATLPDGPESLDITVLGDPTRLNIRLSELWLAVRATVVDDEGITTACRVAPDADLGVDELQSLVFEDVEIEVVLGTADGELAVTTDLINLGLVENGLSIVTDAGDPDYYCNLPECMDDGCFECVAFCETGDLILDLADLFIVIFQDVIDEAVEAVVNDLLETVRTVEGEIHPGLLLGSLTPLSHDAMWLGFRVSPGPAGFDAVPISGVDPTTANDLFLNLAGGTSSEVHECVIKTPDDPVFVPPAPYAVITGSPRPHLVLALADTFVDQALWSAYLSGTLCLFLDPEAVSGLTDRFELNAGLLSLLLPGLDEVADPEAPLLLSVRPSFEADDFPLVHLAEPTEDDSLLSIEMDAVDVGIYAWIQGRYLRLFEVRASLSLGVTLVVLPDNQLQLAIDSVAVSLVDERYNELFTGAELSELINFVLDVAINLLVEGGVEATFSLDNLIGDALGIPINLVVDRLEATGPDHRWLELAVRFEQTGPPAALRAVDTHLEVVALSRGAVEARVAARGYRADQLEYQVRWGFGAWSGFRPATQGRLESPLLWLPGRQTIEVRARAIGDYRSLDMSPATTEIVVPEWPPRGSSGPATVDPPTGGPASAADQEVACHTVRGGEPPAWVLILAGLWVLRRRSSRVVVG